MQVIVGKDTIVDMKTHSISEVHQIFAKLGSGVIECQGQLKTRVMMRPSKETSNVHQVRHPAVTLHLLQVLHNKSWSLPRAPPARSAASRLH